MKPAKAILKNHLDEYMRTLTEDELSFYDARAKDGDVIKFQQPRKGRMTLVFKLKDSSAPNSPNSDCSLTHRDAEMLVGAYGMLGRVQRERLAGWNL